jgi:acyl transferase domain-containing protein/NAD(P)H-dependent flavin oxidoreductase YrpB (nitropropane dioxygenase family)/short-subunit dehydrogenase
MTDSAVDCICLCPVADGGRPQIAIAAERAGGVGILDVEFARDKDAVARCLESLLSDTRGRIGLRLAPDQIDWCGELLAQLSRRPHWLILAAGQDARPPDLIGALPRSAARTLLIEICDAEAARALSGTAIGGLIAKGNEAGGWVGEDSAFVLLQKLLDLRAHPVYVRGGIGPNAAAACHVAGAAGVVLDDQLLLLWETFVPRRLFPVVARLTGQETVMLAEQPRSAFRVMPLPSFRADAAGDRSVNTVRTPWECTAKAFDRAGSDRGWHSAAKAWPAGEAIGLASHFRDQYRNVGRLVRAVRECALRSLDLARSQKSLEPLASLAQAHGTRFPIVQGPMTRVSDTPEFMDSVARGGALPFLALALMRRGQALDLLHRTQSMLNGRPWGVGLLGFVPQALRDEQIEAIREIKPSFALIAGGRPDQSVVLESHGITTYLHVPSPRLLQLFLEQGGRRFVFEGRECGGHTGPLSSFVLWEHMINTLLDHLRTRGGSDLYVLFAGGIHDARTAAMVGTMAAPLVARGVRIGILMGTAYLFTEEAVSCGAIVRTFQEEALRCTHTACLETGPGHLTRCAVTPFVNEFMAARSQLLQGEKSAEEIRDALETLNLGRLRIASKGLLRDGRGELMAVDCHEQRASGMYMIGQAATVSSRVRTIASLHEDVSLGAAEIVRAAAARVPPSKAAVARPSDIAIIGIGTLLPGADSPQQYWKNILEKRNAIVEIPRERWDWRLYFDADRRARDRIYAKWGGFIDEVPFDPTHFGIPPNSMRSIDPLQLLALEVVRKALVDAGYPDGGPDREQTSVILGAGGGLGDIGLQYGVRAELPRVNEINSASAWDRLPEWTEESFPGCLLNVAAGRVANRFNFGGSNFTVDAACASSLAAVDIAVRELEDGRSSLAIAGGVDTIQSPFAYFCFSKTQALSPRGVAQTFDRKADGIVISEGLAVVVLKRLADAERDGDRVYCVIKAIGSSSDGKGLGLTAPLPEGQKRALRRAYEKAGVGAETLGLFEAHGTGTVVGDRAELETIVGALTADGAEARSCALGAVKTLIGHTKATAGAAGLIKAALAIHHRILPPHAGVEQPIDPLADPGCPAFLLKEPKAWLRDRRHPRRAGVNAFGFGGTNFHAVLEEVPEVLGRRSSPPDATSWPCELVVLRAATRESLVERIDSLHRQLASEPLPRLGDLAWTCAIRNETPTRQPFCFAVVVQSIQALRDALRAALDVIEGRPGVALPTSARITDLKSGVSQVPPGMAFLFPGQGAQHPDMLREATLYLTDFRDELEFADAHLQSSFDLPLSQYIYPPSAFSAADEVANRKRLTDTRVAQPAIGALELGCIALAARLGLEPSMTGGHSYGELAALHAAGVLTKPDFLMLSTLRGRALGAACDSAPEGGMAAVTLERERLRPLLDPSAGVVIANHNAPTQSVVSGPRQEVERLVRRLEAEGISAHLLPVAGAFHSPFMAPACDPLTAALAGVAMAPPDRLVFSNVTGEPYPSDPDEIRRLLAAQLLQPVEFVRQIESMYDRGARVFVELGPRSALTGLVGQILPGRAFAAVSLGANSGALEDVLTALATLAVANVGFCVDVLFDGRDVAEIDMGVPRSASNAAARPGWLVSGGWARASGEPKGRTGRLPFLEHDPAGAEDATAPPAMAEPASPRPDPPVFRTPAEGIAKVPARAAAAPPVRGGGGDVAAALLEYQNVMREFLVVQERVMTQFLRDAPVPAATVVPSDPAAGSEAAFASMPDAWQLKPNGSEQVLAFADEAGQSSPAAEAQRSDAQSHRSEGDDQRCAPAIVDRQSLTDHLLTVASERTGYPREVLGTDQDVEAELGIDSIKRVEILGALQQQLPSSMHPVIQAHMDVLTRVKTFNGIVEHIVIAAPAAGESPAVADTGLRPGQDAALDAGLGRDDTLELLLALVSERTGYPRDVLGINQDIEADLGIDSIKRVEILGALAQRLPTPISARLQGSMDALTRIKTLKGIVDALVDGGGGSRTQHPAVDRPHHDADPVPRFRIEARAQALAGQRSAIARGLWLVVVDALSVAPRVSARLAAEGAHAVLVDQATMADGAALEVRLRAWAKEWGRVRGIIHLAGLTQAGEIADLDAWRCCSHDQVKSLFRLLRACAHDLTKGATEGDAWVLATSSLGGTFGRTAGDAAGCPTAGGAVGLLKTVAREWPGVRVKGLDFDPTAPAQQIADQVVEELSSPDRRIEIGYTWAGRTVFDTIPARLDRDPGRDDAVIPAADWVVLVTGGARGITAEAAYELACRGVRLVLVGRRARPTAREPADVAEAGDAAALRELFLKHALATAPHAASPALIEKQVQDQLRDREIRDNLERFERVAAGVEYVSLDVCDEAAMAALLERIYREHGRLDGVIHGAGIIQDKLILDKDEASFDRVFDTKVDSSFILARRLRSETLRFLVFYTSAAGRIGNRGQSDYAAANEVVNRLAWHLDRQWPRTRVVAINWGPWDGKGMATGEVARMLRARGIVPVPPEHGRVCLMDELTYGCKGDVEIIAGTGPWSSFETSEQAERAPATRAVPPRLPLLQAAPIIGRGGIVTMDHVFSLSNDPYLADHRIDRSPVLPLAVVLEWMAEFVQAAWPRWTLISMRDLRVLKGIVLKGKVTTNVRFRAQASTHADGDAVHVAVEMIDVEREVLCYRATALLETVARAPEAGLAIVPLPPARGLDADSAYRDYLFHGERFRLLTAIDAVTESGIDAHAMPSAPAAWLNGHGEGPVDASDRLGEWLFDPGLLDTAPQLAIVWSRVTHDMTAIPNRFGVVTRFCGRPTAGSINVALRVRPSSRPHTLTYDATFYDPDGTVRLNLEECDSACSARLNRRAARAQ